MTRNFVAKVGPLEEEKEQMTWNTTAWGVGALASAVDRATDPSIQYAFGTMGSRFRPERLTDHIPPSARTRMSSPQVEEGHREVRRGFWLPSTSVRMGTGPLDFAMSPEDGMDSGLSRSHDGMELSAFGPFCGYSSDAELSALAPRPL